MTPSVSSRTAKDSAVVVIGVHRRGVGRDDGARRRLRSPHLKLNYWISARPLLVSRTSSPMTVMFPSRPTIRLMLPGIAPPAR
jgi:hypothetical protein